MLPSLITQQITTAIVANKEKSPTVCKQRKTFAEKEDFQPRPSILVLNGMKMASINMPRIILRCLEWERSIAGACILAKIDALGMSNSVNIYVYISGWIFQKVLAEIVRKDLILSQKALISNGRNLGLFAPTSMRFPSKDSKSKDLSF